MEVQFTPMQEAQLARMAAHEGIDATHLDAKSRAAVRRGIAQADRGELTDHDEVVSYIERRLQS